jgi:glucosylceramidase
MISHIPRHSARRSCARIARATLGMGVLACALLLGPTNALAATTFQVTAGGKAFAYTLPGSSAVTLKWTPGAATASAWLTSASSSGLTRKLEASSATFGTPSSSTPSVAVDPSKTYQTIDGFGGALTDSAASVISGSSKHDEIMNALFGSTGARFTFTRLPVGASDFAATSTFHSYDDMPAGQTDPTLAHFSIAHDESYIIPLLRKAQSLSPSLKVLATPWSAPGWMKIGSTFAGTCNGSANYLQNALYPAYAKYLTKFVTAYKADGVPIYMMSLQNEPHNCNSTYPTMNMEPGDESDLAAQLRPTLDAAGLTSVKLLGWDHNWVEADGSPTTYPQQAMHCSGGHANSPIDAAGYHAYGGESQLAAVQTKFHNDCAGKDIYFTEASGVTSATNTAANLVYTFTNALIGPIRNWARASTYWNLALNASNGPHQGGCGTCTGMVTVKSDGSYDLNETYYYWEQFSKFVDPGAVRIDSTNPSDGSLQTVAFKNPDGSIVLVAMNPAGPDAATTTPPASTCSGNPFAWLTGCSSTAPTPTPAPAPAPAPTPPATTCTGNPFAWLFGGC